MKQKRKNLSVKILLMVILVLTGIFIANILLIFQNTKDAVVGSISKFSIQTAEHIASQMDTAKYEAFLKNKTEDGIYWEVREELNEFREKTGSLYVYTLEASENMQTRLLIDGQPQGSSVASPIGEKTDKPTYEQILSMKKGHSLSTDIIHDPEYGSFVSAWVPIKNQKGEVIGILGVDTQAQLLREISREVLSDMILKAICIYGAILLISLLILYFYIQRSLKPLGIISASAQRMAMGDLAQASIQSRLLKTNRMDEIGQLSSSFQQMIEHISELINQVMKASHYVSASAEDLTMSTKQVSLTSEEITQTIQELASGIEKQFLMVTDSEEVLQNMNLSMNRVMASAESVSSIVYSAQDSAQSGNGIIQKAVERIYTVHQTVDQLSKGIEELGDRSREIEKIIEVITDIAEQTNLLSLNAAIEAARAGVHGRGFSIVAEEVRKLAKQSSHSARQISDLVRVIQGVTTKTVQSMNQTMTEVKEGTKSVTEAGQAFEQIYHYVQQVAGETTHTLSNIKEMSSHTHKVGQSIKLISSLAKNAFSGGQTIASATEEQWSSVEELSSSSSSLAGLAKELNHSIGKFKL